MVGKVRSFSSALYGSTDSGVLKFQLLKQLLFTVTQLIISILFEFTLVRVKIGAPIPPPESALWTVPTLLLLALGSRWRAGGGLGRGGASVGGQGVRGRGRRLRRAAGGRGRIVGRAGTGGGGCADTEEGGGAGTSGAGSSGRFRRGEGVVGGAEG